MQSAQASGVAPEDAGAAYGRLLGSLADPERFPAIHAVLAARAFDPPGTTADDVQFGLDRILDGIDVLVRARAEAAAWPVGLGFGHALQEQSPAAQVRPASRRRQNLGRDLRGVEPLDGPQGAARAGRRGRTEVRKTTAKKRRKKSVAKKRTAREDADGAKKRGCDGTHKKKRTAAK